MTISLVVRKAAAADSQCHHPGTLRRMWAGSDYGVLHFVIPGHITRGEYAIPVTLQVRCFASKDTAIRHKVQVRSRCQHCPICG